MFVIKCLHGYLTRRTIFASASMLIVTILVLCMYYTSAYSDLAGSTAWERWPLFQNQKTYCTFHRVKQNSRIHLKFPTGGRWEDNDPINYKPGFCKLQHARMPANELAKCLVNANISYIVTMGDSNSARYFVAINRDLLSLSKKQCKMVKSEKLLNNGFLPDLSYFVNDTDGNNSWTKYVEVHDRQCRGCASARSRCLIHGTSHSVTTEQAAVTSIVDDSIRVVHPAHILDSLPREAPTTQEFWLEFYLKSHYPDLLLIFLPFSHAKHSSRLVQVKADITYFNSLIKTHVPPTTRVVYFPSFSEFEHARTNLMYVNRTYGGMLAAEKIYKMNKILFEVLFNDITDLDSNIHGFLDLFEMSLTRASWSIDGIHMQDVWYNSVVSAFWQILCNSIDI